MPCSTAARVFRPRVTDASYSESRPDVADCDAIHSESRPDVADCDAIYSESRPDVAECDALYTAQENLEAAAEIFEAFVLSLMANVHPPAEDAVTGSPMAKHRKKPANARG